MCWILEKKKSELALADRSLSLSFREVLQIKLTFSYPIGGYKGRVDEVAGVSSLQQKSVKNLPFFRRQDFHSPLEKHTGIFQPNLFQNDFKIRLEDQLIPEMSNWKRQKALA